MPESTLEKARLYFLNVAKVKGRLKRKGQLDPEWYSSKENIDGPIFYVQFNPNTIKYSFGVHSKKKTNLSLDKGRVKGNSDSKGNLLEIQSQWAEVSMNLFLYGDKDNQTDETGKPYPGVQEQVRLLNSYVVDSGKNDIVSSCRRLMFAWGSILILGALKSIDVSYQMFNSQGIPIQAEVSLTIIGEDVIELQKQKEREIANSANRQTEDESLGPSFRWLFDE